MPTARVDARARSHRAGRRPRARSAGTCARAPGAPGRRRRRLPPRSGRVPPPGQLRRTTVGRLTGSRGGSRCSRDTVSRPAGGPGDPGEAGGRARPDAQPGTCADRRRRRSTRGSAAGCGSGPRSRTPRPRAGRRAGRAWRRVRRRPGAPRRSARRSGPPARTPTRSIWSSASVRFRQLEQRAAGLAVAPERVVGGRALEQVGERDLVRSRPPSACAPARAVRSDWRTLTPGMRISRRPPLPRRSVSCGWSTLVSVIRSAATSFRPTGMRVPALDATLARTPLISTAFDLPAPVAQRERSTHGTSRGLVEADLDPAARAGGSSGRRPRRSTGRRRMR